MAVNWIVVPFAAEGEAGVTANETNSAAVTVYDFVPEIEPNVAVIVEDPMATAVAKPSEPDALLMVAIDVLDEAQVTDVVMFCVLLSV